MARFKIGDPVVVLTDRKLTGRVTYLDIEHVWPLWFTPQNFRGQKGWIDWYYRLGKGGEPDSHGVSFSLRGSPRMVLVRRFVGDDCEWPIATKQRLESGPGCLILKADELVYDTEPEGDLCHLYDGIPHETLDEIPFLWNAYWLLKAREATLAPELYLAGLREHYPLISVEEIQMFLEEVITEWRRFQEDECPSIQEYIGKYIGFDWVVSAAEQAERGDSTAFTALIRGVRVDPSLFLRLHEDPTIAAPELLIAVSEPLKVRWK